jgi:xylulokinase
VTSVALGIDIGTGSTKAGLVDADGRLLAVGRCAHPIRHPSLGHSETDPFDWLASVRSAVADVLDQQPEAKPVTVGMSGQMHGVVVTDGDGDPLRPAVLWSDQRSQRYLGELEYLLEPIKARLANPIVTGMAGPTLIALRTEEGGLFAGDTRIMQPKDWVRLQLTGEFATDPSDASATLLWDIPSDGWSAPACAVFGIERSQLPQVVGSDEPAGTLQARPASELDLAAGLPVATGAADVAAALLGSGIAIDETQISTGTGGQLARLIESPLADPSAKTHLYRSATDSWYAMAAIQNAGIAIDWALGILGVTLDTVPSMLETSPPGSSGVVFVPYLTGERTPHMDATLTGSWYGLRPDIGHSDLVRATFEGVAFAMRDGLDALRTVGHTVAEALLAGGGSVAPWWRQMLADVLEIPLIPHDSADASVRGAALLGWAAAGEQIDPEAGVTRLRMIEPDADYAPALARFHDIVATQA